MKQKKPPNMVLSPERARLLMELTDEEAGKVVKALVAYADTQALPEFSGVLLLCFKTLLDDIKQSFEQQAAISERNRQRSMKRWGMPRDTAGCHGMPRDATGYHGMPRDTTGCHGMPRDTTGYRGIPTSLPEEEPEQKAPTGRTPLDLLMTGEDGEPIVIYKHG